MSMGRRVCEAVHVGALGVWLGVLVMSGAAAAVIFPAVKAMNPSLPEFASYTGPHWMIAAGGVANRLFTIADIVQFGGLLVAGLALASSVMFFGVPPRRVMTVARGCLIVLLVGVVSYHLMVLGPRMAANLGGFWAAARAGDNVKAEALRAAFDADHPRASTVLGVIAVLLACALGLGAWDATRGEEKGEGGEH